MIEKGEKDIFNMPFSFLLNEIYDNHKKNEKKGSGSIFEAFGV
jgi:hypothetical protein